MSSRELGALLAAPTTSLSELVGSPACWDELVATAIRERVAPILAHRICRDGPLPPDARRELVRERYHTGAHNLLLYRELARVLRVSPGTSPPILLKGGALASTAYEDISLRPMSDLDLLVPRHDLSSWKNCLIELGYEVLSPEMAPGLAEAVHYQLAFRGGPGRDVVIEIHWNLVAGDADWRAPDIEWFWQQSEPWPGIEELECPAALQLTVPASVLYLSAHAMLQHGGAHARLLWLYDIHRLIACSADAIRWSAIVAKARELQWDAAVAAALHRCRELFETAVPESVVLELEDAANPRAVAHVDDKFAVERSRADYVWQELLCLDVTGRIRLVSAILFPHPTYVKWRYPRFGALWPLAYIYRWSVVVREGVASAFRMLTTAFPYVCL